MKIEKAIEELKSYVELWESEQVDYDMNVIIYKNTIESFNLAIQELEEKLNGGWIPVSDRLPSYDCTCLVTDGENVFIANYDACLGWGSYKFNKTITFRRTKYVTTAWQPLPEPFREVEQ
jgi:hypothetical protein